MITVDTREKLIARIKEIIVDIGDAPQFAFKALDKGDYDLVNGNQQLRIERKSVGDFAGSYGELKLRLHEMRLKNQHTALLLEGTYLLDRSGMVCIREGPIMQPRMKYRTFSNFITHQVSAGTWFFQTMTFDESIYRIIEIHDYLPRLDVPDVIKCGNPTEWMSMLPGVGKSTMEKLKFKYNTPLEAMEGLPERAKKSLRSW